MMKMYHYTINEITEVLAIVLVVYASEHIQIIKS